MNTLRQALNEYLRMRRALGFKLQDAGRELSDFVSFMECHHASYITRPLALRTSPRAGLKTFRGGLVGRTRPGPRTTRSACVRAAQASAVPSKAASSPTVP